MQVTVEEVSHVERRLTIVVPADKVEEAYTEKLRQFAKNIKNIKGFRPGKVPISHVRQRFGADARKEAVNSVMQAAIQEAITEKKLKPINIPQIEPKVMEPDQPLEFVVSFEVLPEIGSIEFAMEEVEKLQVAITAEDIQQVIAQLLKQYTQWHVVDRPAKEKDRVILDYHTLLEGGDKDKKIQDFSLELGSNVMISGFEEGLIGATSGEKRTLSLQFPEGFSVSEQAGKPVDFIVQVKQVFEAEIPALDADFIKKLGLESGKEEDLQNQVRESLELERDRLVKEKQKEQVFQALLEQNPLNVPGSMVAREAKNLHDGIYPQHQEQNHQHTSQEEISAFNDIARKRVALGLLIGGYAKQTDLKVDPDRVRLRIQEIASAYEKPQEVIKWLSSENQHAGIEAQVMEDMVLEKLLENIPVIEKTISYGELKGIKKG